MVSHLVIDPVPDLRSGEVHVWRLPLNCLPSIEDLVILSPEEISRADRFLIRNARDRYCVAHAGLRRILAAYLDLDPRELRFIAEGEGKPSLADRPDLSFNLSHSEDLAVVATGRTRALGVNVEKLRAVPDAKKIAQRYFTAQEYDGILASAEAVRSRFFLQCWTRKEAIVKAAGLGIISALDRVAIPFGPALGMRIEHAGTWDLYDINVASGYVAALAVASGPVKLVDRFFCDRRGASLA